MAKFGIYRSTKQLPGVGTAVRANYNTDTGEAQMWGAVGQAAGAIMDLGIKWDLKEANTQFSKYKSTINDLDQLRSQEVLNAKNDAEVQEIYKKYDQQKEGVRGSVTNKRATEAAGLWDGQQTAKNAKSLFDDRRVKTIDNERARVFEKQQEVKRDPSKLADFEKELARIQILDNNNPDDIGPTFTKLGAAQILADTQKMAEVGTVTNLYRAGKYDEAKEAVKSAKLLSPGEMESLENRIDAEERSVRLKIAAANKIKYDETERDLHKQFIDSELTTEENDRAFSAGESDVATHKAYDTIIKNKDLMDSDSILAEKWLSGSLTKTDIKDAQAEGRLRDSNVVATWMSRLNQGQFNAGAYDKALTRIREVQFDKGKYDDVRLYLLKNADDLGGKWDEVRNRLETAMNSKDDAVGPHVRRAHSYIDGYAKENPEINDGTLESIKRIQRLHDAIDDRADQTPEQIQNLTQALLLPYEEEKAKGWFGTILEYPLSGIPRKMFEGKIKSIGREKRIFQSKMLIQPISKIDFNKEVTSLKSIFGDDSKEARQFYDRYVDSYDWENE